MSLSSPWFLPNQGSVLEAGQPEVTVVELGRLNTDAVDADRKTAVDVFVVVAHGNAVGNGRRPLQLAEGSVGMLPLILPIGMVDAISQVSHVDDIESFPVLGDPLSLGLENLGSSPAVAGRIVLGVGQHGNGKVFLGQGAGWPEQGDEDQKSPPNGSNGTMSSIFEVCCHVRFPWISTGGCRRTASALRSSKVPATKPAFLTLLSSQIREAEMKFP